MKDNTEYYAQFPWDGNRKVKEEYEKDNYKIESRKLGNKHLRALIFLVRMPFITQMKKINLLK